MILPLLVLAGLFVQDGDCPKKPAVAPEPPVVLNFPIPFVNWQAFVSDSGDDDDDTPKPNEAKAHARSIQEAHGARAKARAEIRERDEIVREALRTTQKELEKAGITRQFIINQNLLPGFGHDFPFGGDEPRITLDIENLPARDAIKRLFQTTKFEVDIDDVVSKDCRITLKAPDVRLSTALDMVTEAAGVYWTRELRITGEDAAPKTIYRIRKTPGGSSVALIRPSATGIPKIIARVGPGAKALDSGTSVHGMGFVSIWPEERSKFVCPNCHNTVVTYRQKTKAGSGRSTTPRWKFCPICGKPVHFED